MAYSKWNTAANVGTGAGAGAAAGTAIAPGIGTAIGAGVGALAGVFQSIAQYNNDEARRKKVRELSSAIGVNYDALLKEFENYYATEGKKLFGDKAATDYQNAADAVRDFNFKDYDWLDANHDGVIEDKEKEAAKYTYNRNVDYFLDPALEDLQADAAAKIEHTAAGAGVGRGTGAARAIANSSADIRSKAWQTALQEWKADRDFDYKQWADYNQSMQDRLKSMMSADQWQIGQQKAFGEDWINWNTNAFENAQKIKQDKIDAQTQIGLAGL